MENYNILVTFHILFVGIWLVSFLVDLVYRKKIISESSDDRKGNLVLGYLHFINLLGIIGSLGVLLSGIFMVLLNPGFNFFQMTANHWLSTKQIIMVIILLTTFIVLIPTAKTLKIGLKSKENRKLDKVALTRIFKIVKILNILVLINLLFALSRHFM